MRHFSLISRSLIHPRLSILILFAALSTFWIGLGIAIDNQTTHLLHNWERRLTQTALIVLPINEAKNLQVLTQSLQVFHGVSDLHQLSPSDTNHLLAKWGTSWPNPTPSIIMFHYKDDNETLQKTIKNISPEATLIPSSNNKSYFSHFNHSIKTMAHVIMFVCIVFGIILFFPILYFSLNFTYQIQRSQLLQLHQLGTPAHRSYQSIVIHFTISCLLGGIVGIILLLPALHYLINIIAPLLHRSLPVSFLPFALTSSSAISTIYLIPVIQAVIGCIGSWFFYRHNIHAMP